MKKKKKSGWSPCKCGRKLVPSAQRYCDDCRPQKKKNGEMKNVLVIYDKI